MLNRVHVFYVKENVLLLLNMKTKELQEKIEKLEKENSTLRHENGMLQHTISDMQQNSSPWYQPEAMPFSVPENAFWQQPLNRYWNQVQGLSRLNRMGALPYFNDISSPWMAAEDSAIDQAPAVVVEYRYEDTEETKQKVAQMSELIDDLQNRLERVSEPLSMVVEAIKKKAQFVNVAAAYLLLQQMNGIFAGCEIWQDNVRELEEFLLREKNMTQGNRPRESHTEVETVGGEDQRLKKTIDTMISEGVLPHLYDYTWVMETMNQTDGMPKFKTPASFIQFLKDRGVKRLPSEDTINKKQNAFTGVFPEWEFTDCDTTEATRRINVGKRLLSIYRATK